MEDVKKPHNQSDDNEDKVYEVEEIFNKKLDTDMNYRHKYLWRRVLVHTTLHILWFISLYTVLFHAKAATILWATFIGFWSSQGISMGAHRCLTHKSFKTSTSLKCFLLIWQTIAGQNSMFTWVRDHRMHHKYSDTDADPHNSKRGFFFAHIGWLLVERHPLLLEKQKQIDVSDLKADKMIMFQFNYFLHLYFVLAIIIPASIPMYFWNETLWSSFFVSYCFPYVTNLHLTWTINSFAHLWGPKPYDERIQATQSLFTWIVTMGEGWHNYHHTFPWDYKLAEYGQISGASSKLVEIFSYLGLAYDLKTASPNTVYGHMKRHGDETRQKTYIEKRMDQEDLFEKLMAMF